VNRLLRPRNWEPACGTERSAASANNMAVLPGVLGYRPLRRTIVVRLGTNPAVPRDGCPVARPSSWSRDINSRNIQARRIERNRGLQILDLRLQIGETYNYSAQFKKIANLQSPIYNLKSPRCVIPLHRHLEGCSPAGPSDRQRHFHPRP
jgi:hypothetical protein